MALAIYIVSLAVSAGLFGGFVRQALGELGFVRGLQMALALAAGMGFLYACLQLAYMTAVRALKPTSSPGPLIAESLSHATALVFLPYLLDVSVNWPHPLMAKVEPLIYFGLFGTTHLFFKLASFYAAIRGEPGGRLATGGWLLAATLSGVAGYWLLAHWVGLTDAARPIQASQPQYYRAGDQYAEAQELTEGATVSCDLTPGSAGTLTLRWAPPPAGESEPPSRIYVSTKLIGNDTVKGLWPVSLDDDGWGELNLPAASLPAGLSKCEVTWERKRRPTWQRILGVSPLVLSNEKMLYSGPFLHEERAHAQQPNFLLIVVDGLASRHVSGFGYERKTTPALDALARKSLAFPNAYTPAPETAAACMTLLTGVGPLRHGYLGAHPGPLPGGYKTLAETLRQQHYLTAAFTEGEDDLAPGTGFERGFEIFDPSYVPVSAQAENPGSERTLEKVNEWLEQHSKQKFFLFVRLRELSDPIWRPEYEPGFTPKGKAPSEVDVYDSALVYLDKQIGALLSRFRSTDAGQNTCIVVTSSYGIDFSPESGPVIGLTEESLRVPLIIDIPGGEPGQCENTVGLDSVVPTLLAIVETHLDYLADGANLAEAESDRPAVSVYGSPAVLSMRRDRWRFYWHSGIEPFTGKRVEPESAPDTVEVAPPPRRRGRDEEARKARLAEECLQRFKASL